MFRRSKEPATTPFVHAEDCPIVRHDPDVTIPWSEIRTGTWERVCQCGKQYHHDDPVDNRVRLDPLDPRTSRHLGGCEYAHTTDPAIIKLILTVRPGMAEGYDWVMCNSCQGSWQVPHYAAQNGG
jgi:hypothetical protein